MGKRYFIATAALLASRLLVFAIVYLVLGLDPRSDVMSYFEESERFLREFPSSWFYSHAYGPAFLAVTSLALKVAHGPGTLILLAIGFEVAGFWIWLRVAQRSFSETTVRLAALAYLANPFGAVHVAVLGQNRVWLSPFLATAVWLLGHAPFRSGLAFGFSILTVNFFPAALLPAFLLAVRRPAVWMAGTAVPLAIACALAPQILSHVAGQWRFHSAHLTSGNLTFLLTATGADIGPTHALAIGLVTAVALLVPWAWHYRSLRGEDRDRALVYALAASTLIVLVGSPKSFPGYLMPVCFPLAIAVAATAREGLANRAWVVWGTWGVLASLEPSLWFSWLKRTDFRMLIPGLAVNPRPWPQLVPAKAWLAFSAELALLATYGVLLAWLWRFYKRPSLR